MNPTHEPAQQYATPPSGVEAGGGGWHPGSWMPVPPRQRRSWRSTLRVAVLTVLSIAAAGIPLGLLWSWISPSVPVLEARSGDVVVNDAAPEQFIAADGWFTLLGFAFGVLAAVTVWLSARRHRGPAMLVSVVLGALGAAVAAWQAGRLVGLGDYERWQDAATVGDTFTRPPDLQAYGTLLVPAFAAVIVCTLLAGWSNDPDLDVPGARPGYGHGLPTDPEQHQYGAHDLSSGSPDAPDQTAAPGPPGSGPTAPPRG